jgi:hypothetical protein
MSGKLGDCCEYLRMALAGGPGAAAGVYNSSFTPVGEGGLAIAVGFLPVEDESDPKKWTDISWIDFPARFCPFCGTPLPEVTERRD